MISYESSYTVEWLCDFQMEWFPFDTQSCTMQFLEAENSARLIPEAVDYLGHQLPQHFIRSIAMCSAKLNGKEGVIVEVILGRPIFSKFLTVSSTFGT